MNKLKWKLTFKKLIHGIKFHEFKIAKLSY